MLVAIPIVFRSVYGFTIGESGATYVTQVLGSALGMGERGAHVIWFLVGELTASCLAGIDYFCTKRYLATVDKKGPEARLYTAMSGGVLLPLGTLLFAFTAYPQVYWVVPCIGCTVLYSGSYALAATLAMPANLSRTRQGCFASIWRRFRTSATDTHCTRRRPFPRCPS